MGAFIQVEPQHNKTQSDIDKHEGRQQTHIGSETKRNSIQGTQSTPEREERGSQENETHRQFFGRYNDVVSVSFSQAGVVSQRTRMVTSGDLYRWRRTLDLFLLHPSRMGGR